MKRKIRIGTRRSDLALRQTELFENALKKKFPEIETERVIKITSGDKKVDVPLSSFGGKGAFVEEFEDALLSGEIDIAVHSAKDLPQKLKEGTKILGALPRGDVRDVLVSLRGTLEKDGAGFSKILGDTIFVGTSSPRRKLQLENLFPCKCTLLRGNVPTRLSKLRNGDFDCVILAAAGLSRLSLLDESDFEYHFFSADEIVPAGGQGIIALQGREDDSQIAEIASSLSDKKTMAALDAERYFLLRLGYSCTSPVGVHGVFLDKDFTLTAVIEKNGKPFRAKKTGAARDWKSVCDFIFESLLQNP